MGMWSPRRSTKGHVMTWEPVIDGRGVLYPGTDDEVAGRVVEDFGDFTAHDVAVNDTRISDPARRWAVSTDDGGLSFVDTADLAPPST